MAKKTFRVPNISCKHCTHTIETELSELTGVAHVNADANSKQVMVEWEEPATWESIRDLLKEINYPAED